MESTAKGIKEYELIDHGNQFADYFRGCGTMGTPYDHVVTGIGIHPADAIDDALEQMAQQHDGLDLDALEKQMLADNTLTEWPKLGTKDADEDSDAEYHVSIRYNLA